MYKKFLKQIPKNVRKIAIYGAGTCGIALRDNIRKELPDIDIEFFIDSYKSEDNRIDIPIYKTSQIDEIKDKIDMVLISVRNSLHVTVGILKYFNIPYLFIPYQLESKIRNSIYQDNYKNALKIFSDKKSKKLYEELWNAKLNMDYSKIAKFAAKKHNIKKGGTGRNYSAQYLEYINKDAIQTIFDCGFCNGAHVFGFKKVLKNLKTDYAFEPLYDELKEENLDILLKKLNCVQIVPYGVWDKKEKLNFIVSGPASRVVGISNLKPKVTKEIETITLDEAKEMLDIKKVDFIKMDIEGAELPALKGAEKILLNDRPQLAISIYHSSSDFVNIPIHLKELLKDYSFYLGHYAINQHETVLFCIPNELKTN